MIIVIIMYYFILFCIIFLYYCTMKCVLCKKRICNYKIFLYNHKFGNKNVLDLCNMCYIINNKYIMNIT